MKPIEPKHRPVIDLNQAHSLGIRFCAERNARKLSLQDVADALLLSKQQVLGLEIGDLKSFYGAKLFAQAADKYAAFLAFAEKPSVLLIQSNSTDTPSGISFEALTQNEPIAMAQPEAVVETSTETIDITAPANVIESPHRKTPVVTRTALALALAAVVGVVGYTQQQTLSAISPLPHSSTPPQTIEATQPAVTMPQAQAQAQAHAEAHPEKPEAALPADAPKPIVSAGRIELTFSGASWVQAVDKNGSKQEKIYRNGDTLALNPGQLQALIIGNSSVVSITSNKKTIDLKPYIGQGSQVARIIGSDIRQLGE